MEDKNNRQRPWSVVHEALGVSAPAFDDRSLGQHVQRFASASPDLVALQYQQADISYGQLNDYANRLARVLQSKGVGREDVIGIHLPNVPQYVIALIAISRLGCIGTGLSQLLTPAEFAYQVEDANVKVLLTLDEFIAPVVEKLNVLPACLQTIIVSSADVHLQELEQSVTAQNVESEQKYDDYSALLVAAGDKQLLNTVAPDDIFMLLYTGGTTGRPKGAMLTHRNLMHNVLMSQIYRPWREGEEVLSTAFPLFHAAGLTMTIAALRNGASVTLIPNPRDIEHFCEQMIRRRPTRFAAVPTLYQMLLDCPAAQDVDFTQLKTAVSGAAPLTSETRRRVTELIGEDRLCDVYGMTETGPLHVTNPPGRVKPDSVGIPLPGADTRIVDAETGQNEMPPGEPGEIITSGPQVMRGYLNLPDETANALRSWQGETYMYTGDIGYMDEEGYIYLCDRAKDMLIVGGFKVFSVELEDKLAALDCIETPVIVGIPDLKRPGNDIVTLFVKPAESSGPAVEAQITAFCEAEMAAYKRPRVVHFLDEVPLTSVGKIDKKVLRVEASRLAEAHSAK
jgi:long-chain acyl-CoA synthetase